MPVYVKTDKNMEWPKDKLFYILSSDGLFLCRNSEWGKSCSPAKHGPGELESQKPFATFSLPIIPKALIEQAVGFFRRIEKDHHWEAALLLVYNRQTKQVELVCPAQENSGASVNYEIPTLPQHLALIGDIHSHPGFSPTPSITDEEDETKRPGLHIVAGYMTWKNVEFYCVHVVDGQRFVIKDHDTVMEPYEDSDPDAVPQEWLDKVKAKKWQGGNYYGGYSGGEEGSYSGGYHSNNKPDKRDKEIIAKIEEDFLKQKHKPTWAEVKQELFRSTKVAGLLWCEARATDFLKEWDKEHEEKSTQTQATK